MKKISQVGAILGMCMLSISSVVAMPAVSGALMSPLWDQTRLLAPFGENRGTYSHQGVDVAVPMGTPLYAVADGRVTKAAPDSKGVNTGGGHMIFIDHGDGTESRYMHLETYAVKTGDFVKMGDLIGFSGASGDATAPILHYEYRIYGQPVDPYFIFELNGSLDSVEDSFLVVQQ